MIASILASVGIPVLSKLVSKSLKAIDSPVAQAASEALDALDDDLTPAQVAEANRHAETLAQLEVSERTSTLAQINETMRAEIASQDRYVRHMRPTFGYLMAMTWAAQMFGLAYVIVADPARAGEIMAGTAQLTGIWGIGLSVLGIYVYKRSEDKKLQ